MNAILRLWRTRRITVIASAVGVVVVIAGAIALIAMGGDDDKKVSVKSTTTTTRPPPKPGKRAPLTGLIDKTGKSLTRPAVTVKINNTDAAKQYGVHLADVVYEEVVEGGATRLAAIFNSRAPERVGPVRSVRRTDQSIVWPVGGVFVFSGGAQNALDSIDTAPVTQLDETRAGDLMYRAPGTEYNDPDAWDEAPMNLWARVDRMYATPGAKPIPPKPLFTYRKSKERVGGTPVKHVVVGFQAGFEATWDWDAASGTWLRTMFGGPDIDADNVRLAPQNVVVMFVEYAGGAGADGAEAVITGTGIAFVYTNGKEIKGTWSRPDKAKPARLLDANGRVINLTRGQTWVELPDASYPVIAAP